MEFEKLGDLTINGFGSSNGGIFSNVYINGKGTLNGDIQCQYFECNGAGTVNGNIMSRSLEVKGTGKVMGDVESINLKIEGNGSISGNALSENMVVSGLLSVGGNVKGDEIKLQGKLSVGGDCECESFHADGKFSIGGLLSAEHINIYTFGDCKVKEMGGREINVKQQKSMVMSLLKKVKSFKFEAVVIEGDEIRLENTKAHIVRGNNVTIGENCEIDLVEYKGNFEIEKNGYVAKYMQI